jgi:hypothetical protein
MTPIESVAVDTGFSMRDVPITFLTPKYQVLKILDGGIYTLRVWSPLIE